MMMAKNAKPRAAGPTKVPTKQAANNGLKVHAKEGDNVFSATAGAILAPGFRHGVTAFQIHKAQFGSMEGAPGFADYADAFEKAGERARKGELAMASELLASQAITLDNIFTEMARRMAFNMGDYLGATEIYARIAMKAQAQSRATIEVLAKLHQPREQTVRHVHVNEGGQAVIADEFHNHGGGPENARIDEQSHATGATGKCAALPSANPLGDGVPISSCEGAATVSDARRHKSGRT